MKNIQFYYITENQEILYFDYINAFATVTQIAKSSTISVPYFDGLEWIHNNQKYKIELTDASTICILKDKIFVQYNGISALYPAPNNLAVYTPTGDLERIISTPILPTEKKGAGIHQVLYKDENHVEVKIWEHVNSPWIYFYDLNINTYDFTFHFKSY